MPADLVPKTTEHAYLVVLDDVLVAMDIAETIREFSPGATVLVAANEAEAMTVIGGLHGLVQAFVAAEPNGFSGSALCEGIAVRGGSVVLLGDEAEEAVAVRWPVLQRPFGRDTLLGHLRNPRQSGAA